MRKTDIRYDRLATLRRGAGVVLFLLALGLLGPGLFGLAWGTDTPETAEQRLLVALAVLYVAAAIAVIAWPLEAQRAITGLVATARLTSLPPRARKRVGYALAFSLAVHVLILSLQFGVAGLGLPGLALPWTERRVQVSELTVRLEEAPRPAPPAPGSAPLALSLELTAPKPVTPPRQKARDREVRPEPRPPVLAMREPPEDAFKVPPRKRAEPAKPSAPQIAEKKPEEPLPTVEATEQLARQAEAVAPPRAEEDARRQALELEARKVAEETAKREAEELARKRALALQKELEAKKQEEAKAQEELKKQEEAKRLALEQETLKRAEEAARQQAIARQKELEAKRQAEEAAVRAKETAERQRAEAEAAAQRERLAAVPKPGAATAPGAPSGSELAAKALEQIRKPAPTRIDPPGPPLPPVKAEDPRRRSIFGGVRDVGLRMYVESWRSKIERNGSMNYRRATAMSTSHNPVVTVSIRSDGSLENVVINRSSGVRELDQAALNIARLYAPYSKFPPPLANQYDVIDIRREWVFDNTLKIVDTSGRDD